MFDGESFAVTVENICRICERKKKPCNEPCKEWYECLEGKTVKGERLLRATGDGYAKAMSLTESKTSKNERRTSCMDEQEAAIKFNDHDHEIKSLKHRVESLEEKQSEISSLTNSVNELAINMRYMLEEQKEQGDRLKKLENEPADNAKYYRRTIIGCICTTLIGGLLGTLLTLIVSGGI